MAQLQRMADGIHSVDDASQRALAQALGSIDLSDRHAVSAVLSGTVMAGARASSELAAQFYRAMSLLQTGRDFDADGSFAYDFDAAEVAISGMYKQAAGDQDKLARLIGERVSYEINRAAKVGVWRNGQRDDRDVRYARVPTGAETCAWCLMTAGLGFWFMTAEAASHTHRGCDCQIVPSIGIHAVRIDGYDSTKYRDMWREANRMLSAGEVPSELAARVDLLSNTRDGYRVDTNGALAVMRWKYGLK
jgi:hypothetical protein